MTLWLSLWIIAAVLFLCFDTIWLLRLGRAFYTSEIGGFLRPRPNLPAAGLFYVIYISGLVTFVAEPAYESASARAAFGLGCFFGFVAYGTFDLTDLAILKGFTAKIAAIDLLWGSTASGLTAALTVITGRALLA